ARVTVNFSGILLRQLRDYCAGLDDRWALLGQLQPAQLDQEQRRFITRNFFSANQRNLIAPHSAYAELQAKVQRDAALDDQELLDLQLWFNLAWIGFSAQ